MPLGFATFHENDSPLEFEGGGAVGAGDVWVETAFPTGTSPQA